MYNIYKEIDLDYIYKSVLCRINLLKSNNIYINKPRIKFYFYFNKVVDPDFEKIYENLFILWFFTEQRFKVSKIKSKLIRGYRYYWFFLELDFIFNINFFESFFFSLKPFIGNDNVISNYIDDSNNFWFYVINIRGFNNIRLLDYFYLIGIYKELLINFYTKKNNKFNYFKSPYYFLSLLKGVKS